MTDTLETKAQTPSDPPAPDAQDAPSGAERRRRRAEDRAAAKSSRRSDQSPAPSRARRIDIEIEPGDPLLVYLQSASGPVEIGALPDYSPAVARMIAQEVQLVVPLVTSGELVGILALGSACPRGRTPATTAAFWTASRATPHRHCAWGS